MAWGWWDGWRGAGAPGPEQAFTARRIGFRTPFFLPHCARNTALREQLSDYLIAAYEVRTKGTTSRPVDWSLLETKFRDTMSFSANPVSDAKLDQAIEMIHNLENLKDATELLRVLT